MPANPICVALDTPDLEKAVALAKALKPHVGWAKVGMEFFYAHGLAGYTRVAETGLPIFLDLKLHDIPNTVTSAMKALMRITPTPGSVNLLGARLHLAGAGLNQLTNFVCRRRATARQMANFPGDHGKPSPLRGEVESAEPTG